MAKEKRARLTRAEAVTWVMVTTRSRRPFAVRTVKEAQQGRTPYGMTFNGTHWLVPAATAYRGRS
jgi:hypothetical protein